MTLPSLEDFIRSDDRNTYVRYRSLVAYVRKSRRLIDDRRLYLLDLANIENRHRRIPNGETKAKYHRTGQFREFNNLLKQLTAKHGFDGVYVENVFNEFLPAKLLEYGYRLVDNPNDGPPCFIWLTKGEQTNEGV
jgi:hypothetical protein